MSRAPRAQQGAALLSAMVVVALVATIASAALWQQWRQVEIEAAERGRSQTQWMMTGALDWTRLILREDALSGTDKNVDHLASLGSARAGVQAVDLPVAGPAVA